MIYGTRPFRTKAFVSYLGSSFAEIFIALFFSKEEATYSNKKELKTMELLFTTEKLWKYGKNFGTLEELWYYGQNYCTVDKPMVLYL